MKFHVYSWLKEIFFYFIESGLSDTDGDPWVGLYREPSINIYKWLNGDLPNVSDWKSGKLKVKERILFLLKFHETKCQWICHDYLNDLNFETKQNRKGTRYKT